MKNRFTTCCILFFFPQLNKPKKIAGVQFFCLRYLNIVVFRYYKKYCQKQHVLEFCIWQAADTCRKTGRGPSSPFRTYSSYTHTYTYTNTFQWRFSRKCSSFVYYRARCIFTRYSVRGLLQEFFKFLKRQESMSKEHMVSFVFFTFTIR